MQGRHGGATLQNSASLENETALPFKREEQEINQSQSTGGNEKLIKVPLFKGDLGGSDFYRY